MQNTLREWCEPLIAPVATTVVLANQLGTITDNGSAVTPMRVKPNDTRFTEARLTSERGSDQLFHLAVTLSTPISLEKLSAVFGPARDVPRMPRKLPMVTFAAIVGDTHSCTVFADVSDQGVQSLTLRRDIRLD